MKTLVFILILLSFLVSCNDTLVEPKEPIEDDTTIKYPNCPLYNESISGQPRCDEIISVSNDAKYSSIRKYILGSQLSANRWILNNLTGEYLLVGGTQQHIEFDSTVLTQFRYIGLKHYFEFSPYNSDIVVFTTFSLVDTVGDKKEFIGRDNLFTYNMQTKELNLITPRAFGKGGAIYLNNEGMRVKWLPESTPGNDIFYIRYNKNVHFKYFLQQDKLEEIEIEPFTMISNDMKIRFIASQPQWAGNPKYYKINEKELYLYDTLKYRFSEGHCISSDNKYLATQVYPTDTLLPDSTQNQRHIEIWVVEIDKWLASSGEFKDFRKINPRFQHCMYLDFGKRIEFTPQNTLIVSMHSQNSAQANIYEMDLKGNILRKITNN